MKCKALAKFLNSSIMIFIYSAYFAARIDFTLGKPLFLWQIFHLRGFPLPFPSSVSHTQLPTSLLCVSFISEAQSCPLTVRMSTSQATLVSHPSDFWGPPCCPQAVLGHRGTAHTLWYHPPHGFTKGKGWAHDKEAGTALPHFKRQCPGTNNPSHLVTASFINSN